MANQWFYRMFGEEFGPMPLEKLKELADGGTIQALDYVRSSSSQEWVAAATIDDLGLSASERRTVPSMAVTTSTDLEISTPAVNDDWFCQLGGQELGPLSFDELLEYVENEQLGADDEVKLGPQGKWRRVGSIGRLMAALPYQAVEKTIVPTAQKPTAKTPAIEIATVETPVPIIPVAVAPAAAAIDTEAAYRAAYEQVKARVTESMLAQADAAFKAAEAQAQAQVAWASAPNVDRFWWGWAGGVEFGPVEFAQVMGLAMSGQLKPSDFVKNGQYGQFVPSANVPGLLKAIEILARAAETRNLARSQAQAAADMAAPPTIPSIPLPVASRPTEMPAATQQPLVARSNPVIAAVAPKRSGSDPQIAARTQDVLDRTRTMRPAAAPDPVETPAPQSASTSGGFGSSSSSSFSSYGSKPAAAPYKPPVKKRSASESTWFSDTMVGLKEPKALAFTGAIAVFLLGFGWGYLPKSRAADIKRYQTLKTIVDEIRSKRSSSPNELPPLQQKLEKTAKEIAAEVKAKASREEPAKQCLLWATRDEIPRVLQAGLATESEAEKNLVVRLQEAAYELGLEKRPVVAVAQVTEQVGDE